jgi:hypothetical protein
MIESTAESEVRPANPEADWDDFSRANCTSIRSRSHDVTAGLLAGLQSGEHSGKLAAGRADAVQELERWLCRVSNPQKEPIP